MYKYRKRYILFHYERKKVEERRVAGVIGFLVNDRSLQLEYARVLYESLLVPVLTYGNETYRYGGRGKGL